MAREMGPSTVVGDRHGRARWRCSKESPMCPDHHSDVPLDPGGLDEIEEKDCWALLATHNVARLAVTDAGAPHVVPVNYALAGHTILFRSDSGTKLAAIHHSRVALEIDELDPIHHSGWSVVVRGVAQKTTVGSSPHGEEEAAAAARLQPWAPGDRPYLVRVVADGISGRRIRPAEIQPAADLRGFL